MPEPKRIAVITTGGTISSISTDKGVRPEEGVIGELLARLGYRKEDGHFVSNDGGVVLKVVSLFNKDSTNVSIEDRIDIAGEAFVLSKTYDGIVITHGTDSLDITAHDLSLWIDGPSRPIIIASAFKKLDDKDSDALENLEDAVTFACDGACGVFMVSRGQVFEGSWVYENVDKRLGLKSFESAMGPVAYLNGPVVEYLERQPRARPPMLETRLDTSYNPNVVLLNPLLTTVEKLEELAKKADGIVLEASTSGGVPEQFHSAIESIAKVKPVVVTQKHVRVTDRGVAKQRKMTHDDYEVAYRALALGAIGGSAVPAFDVENLKHVLGGNDVKGDLKKARKHFTRNMESMQFSQLYSMKARVNGTRDATEDMRNALRGAAARPNKKLKIG